MAEQQEPNSQQQNLCEDKIEQNTPGSQSSSGMSDQINDSLVDAMEREKLQRGEDLDVSADALGGLANNQPQGSVTEQNRDGQQPGSPINRDPEATTGPVVD
ncbi:hypothetical protein [Solirubrum puertoriconensis]|uniref:Uncharacterized protein n=1 Tax=Solirubrum puertoriconensis TaxID=1751427 RepID=A0A9X0L5C6_SOLP1|nr:hypothetical protein [Solirubrum puertoriconensis]KUG08415.1 hypothetical protein ASU33_09620 [Solirubrum puertoriconensis]